MYCGSEGFADRFCAVFFEFLTRDVKGFKDILGK
jgi:hypothetical protein